MEISEKQLEELIKNTRQETIEWTIKQYKNNDYQLTFVDAKDVIEMFKDNYGNNLTIINE